MLSSDSLIDSSTLRMLSALLGAPGHDSLAALRELSSEHPWLAEAVKEIEGRPLDQWQGEHTRLFINGHPKTPCPPFQSTYLDGMMHGPVTEALGRVYRATQLEPGDVPPDYLGALLELAACQIDRADRIDPELRLELWGQHLQKWVPRFAQDLIEASELILYRRLGEQLLRIFPEHVQN